jgi:hypothetical protein
MAEERRRQGLIYVVGGFLSAIAAVVLFPSQIEQAYNWFASKYEGLDAVSLPATYPGELWKTAKSEEFAWLADEWCYATIPGFRTRFRVNEGGLERQNTGDQPKPFTTEWWKTKVYVSNNGVLRIWYENSDLPGDYIEFRPDKTAEWKEYQRFSRDDGSITSGKKRLVLSCKRCSLSSDGITYSCQ